MIIIPAVNKNLSCNKNFLTMTFMCSNRILKILDKNTLQNLTK